MQATYPWDSLSVFSSCSLSEEDTASVLEGGAGEGEGAEGKNRGEGGGRKKGKRMGKEEVEKWEKGRGKEGGENRHKGEGKKKGTGVRLCANSLVLGRKLDPDHKKRFLSKKNSGGKKLLRQTFSAKVKIFLWSSPPNCASTFRYSSSRAWHHK